MKRKQTRPPLPKRLEAVRQRFERWRSDPNRRRAIPKSLWNRAAKLAGIYGVHKTARALRVNYATLKERLAVTESGDHSESTSATFLELVPADGSSSRECLVEFESRHGRKMRVQFKNADVGSLEALARSFWSDEGESA